MLLSKVSLSRTLLPNLFTLIATLAAGTFGCSSENPSQGAGGAGGSGASGTGSSSATMAVSGSGTASSGSGVSCMGPGYQDGSGPQLVDSVQATLVDFNAAPLPNLAIQVCGTDICLNGTTNASGTVIVNAAGKMLTKPAFKYADGIDYARFGVPLPPQPTVMFPTLEVARLPALGTGATLAAGQSATSGDVTITVPTAGNVEIDTLLYDDAMKQQFRSVTIPIAKASPAVDPTLMLELLYAVTPLDTLFCPAAMVSVPNSAGWPAGTDVEFFVHGLDISQEWAPYGGWAKASDGKVSADGSKIETAATGGFNMLSDFGIRRK